LPIDQDWDDKLQSKRFGNEKISILCNKKSERR
jgi:hypothetical protein